MNRSILGALIAALGFVLFCLLLPDVFINPFLEWKLKGAFAEAYPGHAIRVSGFSYNVWLNRVACDSVSVTGAGSTPVFRASRVDVSGIGRLRLLLGGGLAGGWLGDVRAEARDVSLAIAKSHHELRCASVQVSAPDSSLAIDGLRYRPQTGDEGFFAGSSYRRTRYRLDVPRVRVNGLAWLMPGDGVRARTVRIADPSLSVLIDKEKPVDEMDENPRLPAELLASFAGPLKIDSVLFLNGRLDYQERTGESPNPAVLTFDGVELLAEGVGNRAGGADTLVVHARGLFMGDGAISVWMAMPVGSLGLSFRSTGSLGTLQFIRMNPFAEASEGLRLKTGILHSASFDIDVADGRAIGVVRAAYEDLKVVLINRRTGSEGDVVDSFVSLIANNVKLRTTNMPDDSGVLRAGTVGYDHQNDETFLESAWFAVRSGLGDVVGF